MYTSAKPYFYGTGRRKKSIARVRVYPGTGVITINGRNIDDYFGLETMKLIVNRAPNGELNPGVMEEINKYGLQLAGVLPQDDTVYTYDCEGKPSSQVPDTAPVKKALAAIMQELKL